jgi:adenylate cyclase
VNTASRLESLAKEFEVELIVSEDIEAGASLALDRWPVHEIAVRGRSQALKIHAIAHARELSP